MKIRVNGEFQVVECGLTITEFVKQLDLDETRLVVELNAQVILKLKYSETVLVDGDVLELVEFVAGG
ncbi:MAG: sulfur carrier protein ThiS [Lentisphaeria bacterium]|nr:sulfur carrier protein ThiS [Lentisphaeria bacterium]